MEPGLWKSEGPVEILWTGSTLPNKALEDVRSSLDPLGA